MKNFTKSTLLLAVGLMLAVNAWGSYVNPTTNIIEPMMTVVSGWTRSDASTSGPNSGEAPDKAIDGNIGTQWISWACNSEDRAWLAVDLGEEYSLTEFATIWQQAGRAPSRYIIQVASSLTSDAPDSFENDVNLSNTGWTTVAEINETQVIGSENRYAFNTYPVRARYVRIACSNYIDQIGLTEFRLYSDGNSSVEVVPTITSAPTSVDIVSGSTTLELVAEDHNGDPLKTFVLQDQFGKYYYAMTDANDEITISGLEDKRYILTAWAVESGCRSAARTIVVGENTFSSATNFALNKPAYAVGYKNDGEKPEKANDGNLGNGWRSAEPVPEADRDNVWWYVDLEDQFELKHVGLFWEGAYATGFIMQIRKEEPTLAETEDDNEWTTFLTYSGEPKVGDTEDKINLYGDIEGAAAAFDIVPKGRYVRIRITNAPNWGWGVKLRELRIFANGYLPLDNVKPVVSTASYNGVNGDYTAVKFNVATTDDVTDPVTQYLVIDKNKKQHHVTASEGIISVLDMPSGKNQNVSIYAFDAAGNRSNKEEVSITYLRPDENIAENKTTNACRNINEGEGHTKAVDGKENTDWTSYGHANHANDWWYVDLGDYYDIRRIEVVWTTDRHSTDYDIQYRQYAPEVDGATASEWHTISEFAGKSGNQSIDIVDTKAQYICMRSRSGNTGDQVRLAEFRVFGKAFATTDSEAPMIAEASYNGVSADWTVLKFNITVSDNVTANADLAYVVEDPNGTEHTATYSEGIVSVTGMPTFKDGDFIIYATDAADNKSTGYVVENVSYVDPTENLALNKSAYACVHINDGEGRLMPVDGNVDTRWTSYSHAHHDNDWWYVDLGDFYDIRRIEVIWQENRHSTDFSIQYRQNAPEGDSGATEDEWETKYSNLSGDQELDDISNMQARYICMRSKDYYYEQEHAQVRMAEFRVFGKAFATADANPPVITTAYVHYNNDGKAYLHLEATDIEDGEVKRFRVTNTNTSAIEILTTNEDDEIVIDGLTIGTLYTFEIEAMDNVDNLSDVTELKVNVPAPTSANIAPLGQASAGYEHQASEAAGKANDGNANTLWTNYGCSNNEDEWWAVKLDGVYHLTKIAVLWKDDNYASKYTIKVRMTDADEWETLTQITNTTEALAGLEGTDRVVETEVDKIAGQVRIDIDEDHTGGFTRVYEVKVYADAKMISFVDDGNNSDLIDEYNDHEAIVVLNRDITADNTWYTLCLPFDMSAEKVNEVFGEGTTIAELIDTEDKGSLIRLNFDFVNAMVAGKPYMIKVGQDFIAGSTISGVTIQDEVPIETGDIRIKFVGTYNKIKLEAENQRFVADDNMLYSPAEGGTWMGAFRCYFTIPDGSPASAPGKRAYIVFGPQGATGMDAVEQNAAPSKIMLNGVLYIIRDGKTYNAQGMVIGNR